MKHILALEFEQGHLFLSDNQGGYFIVDTGSPTTICEVQQLEFLGKSYHVSTNYGGLTVPSLRNFIPNAAKKIVGLLGNDIMSNYWVSFDVRGGEAIFGDSSAPELDNWENYTDLMGVPLINIELDGTSLRAFFDSGANLSYIKTSISNNWNSVGIKEDFHPLTGVFQTPHYIHPTIIQGKQLDVNWGNLPAGQLAMVLSMGIVDAIVGVDLFAQATVVIDYRNQRLAIQ
jgi:hypothetical protein